MADTIGLIAGGGQFPFLVAREARAAGHRVVAVGFAGNTDPALAAEVDAYVGLKLGQLGKLLSFFSSRKVSRVTMAGTIDKARALDIRPDLRGARVLLRLAARGDDALLRAITAEIERDGFPVVSPHTFVPGLAMPAGVLTTRPLSEDMLADIRFAWPVGKALGAMDIGQTLVVKKQVVAAVEALEGTDACIRRGGQLAGAGATVVKVFKPGQEERADRPSVGLATIATLREAGAGCLAVEARESLFFDREAAVAAADAAGLVIVGVTPELLES